jgi:prevent-host-death family protein
MQVGIREAKSDLSKLIEAALGGLDVVITKRGKPLVRLVPEGRPNDGRKGRGCLKDINLPQGWDSAELDEEIANQFDINIGTG